MTTEQKVSNWAYRGKSLTILTALVSLATGVGTQADTADSRLTLNLNSAWRFYLGDTGEEPAQPDYDYSGWDLASLPHSHRIYNVNLDGFQEAGRDVGWYRRDLTVPEEWRGKKLYLEFQGAMQATTLWVNGRKVGEYAVSGYDSFHFDITPHTKPGRNLIAVRVDNRPNPNLPPDGRKIDYVLFGGLYRDVFLHVTDPAHLTFPWESRKAGVRVTLPEVTRQNAVVEVEAAVRNDSGTQCACAVESEIRDQSGRTVATMSAQGELDVGKSKTFVLKSDPIRNPILWSPENPYLYRVVTRVTKGGEECDRIETKLGMRWVRFDKEQGFFLNGEQVKLIGANRHQTWPFIGNAVPNGLHRRDAEQMKAMGINWVRLSHYPHDPDFLDALDELGLMATAEPPTWMWHGSPEWMDNLEKSFRRMIRRDRNHPSIILWAACINHRKADEQLIKAAAEEDPTRERGQDTVYLPMNFHPGVVSGRGSLTVEHTGHTFPTRRGERVKQTRKDWSINREYEQAQRHWLQTDAAYRLPDNAGLAVWCMYDYNTFHNTDERGLTWHGVADLFRLPKFSYWWHKSELTEEPMAYVVRIDDRHACVFSNGDRVRLLQDLGEGYVRVGEQAPEESYVRDGQRFNYALRHPPFQFIVSAQATALKAEALVGGSVKATHEWRKAGSPVALAMESDRTEIVADGADLSRIVVSAVDASGTVVADSGIEVTFSIEGNGQLIGENPSRLRDGQTIILAQPGFSPGALSVRAQAPDLDPGETDIGMVSVGKNVDVPEEAADKVPTARSVVEIERRRLNRRGGIQE